MLKNDEEIFTERSKQINGLQKQNDQMVRPGRIIPVSRWLITSGLLDRPPLSHSQLQYPNSKSIAESCLIRTSVNTCVSFIFMSKMWFSFSTVRNLMIKTRTKYLALTKFCVNFKKKQYCKSKRYGNCQLLMAGSEAIVDERAYQSVC